MEKFRCAESILLISATLLIGCSSEQSDWEDVRDNPSVSALEEFLTRYPESEHKEQATLLQTEARSLQSALDEGNEQALRRFMAEFPESALNKEARRKHDTMVQKALASFEPEYLLIIDDFGLVDLVRNPNTGTIEMRPMAEWRGELRYALGQEGRFTGQPTYLPPDPAAENVAIAVMNDTNLTDSLQAGRMYVWRGGDLIYEWQDISTWGSRDDIAARLEMPGFTEYAALPSELVAGQ